VTNIVILNNQTHRSLRVQPEPSARYGDNQRFVQIIVGEFPHLVVQYPILLSKSADTGAFFCGAMLGVDEGENLFLNEGGHEGHRPLNLQRMPFYVSGAELGIDLDHPRVSQERGQALFTDEGEATAYLESIKAAFRDLKPGIEMTKAFIDTLLRLKLVEPIDIKLGFDDGSKRELAGLYTINQSVLRGLPDASVLELFRRGYLQLIYLMVASLKQVPVLARKKNDRLLQASEALASRVG
jgi:SapC